MPILVYQGRSQTTSPLSSLSFLPHSFFGREDFVFSFKKLLDILLGMYYIYIGGGHSKLF